ncbi:hypothetical protein GALMADRAFT_144042 [Galerina marginata CBS 339.88]|uniref:Uncharacterized protein n=1 Tax=Galerina marginata (strain CBS 339.88) TaxID=685588 RepID=A0A067SX61_GALM3|nr:hypothetical protein GALMADRAFT_144042 [Galerina marginata CBS 339.88]
MSLPAAAAAADPSFISLEKSFTSADLNSVVLFTFLMGIYTMVYLGTLILYLIRKSSQRRMVIFSITLLYLLGVIMLGVQWYGLERAFLVDGETLESTFTALITVPGWSNLLGGICTLYMIVIADGLLVWRCFFVWNRSLRVSGLPFLLFLTEIGEFESIWVIDGTKFSPTVLCFVGTIFLGEQVKFERVIPIKIAVLLDNIEEALFFTSLSSSLLATLLIAFRIHKVSKQDGRSQRRFGHVIEIVVQSAAIYSFALLIPGIGNTLTSIAPANVAFENYGEAVAFSIIGIVPTIMVARVCLAADTSTHVSTLANLSGLQFQGRSTRQNGTQIMVEDAPATSVEVVFTDKAVGTA